MRCYPSMKSFRPKFDYGCLKGLSVVPSQPCMIVNSSFLRRYTELAQTLCSRDAYTAHRALRDCFDNKNKALVGSRFRRFAGIVLKFGVKMWHNFAFIGKVFSSTVFIPIDLSRQVQMLMHVSLIFLATIEIGDCNVVNKSTLWYT